MLRQITLPFVDHDQCQDMLRQTTLGQNFRLDSSFNCAGGKSQEDTCRGDGGSPLFCPFISDPSRFVQLGLVAWGIGCGEVNVPGAYASVPHGLCFIKWTTYCKVSNLFPILISFCSIFFLALAWGQIQGLLHIG